MTQVNTNPFTFGRMIIDPHRFIGRRAELTTIIDRLNGSQPQGSAVVGPRRLGKSSLLYYLAHPRSDSSLRPAPNQRAIYLDASKGECSTPERFRLALVQELFEDLRIDRRTIEGRILGDIQDELASGTPCSWEIARTALSTLPYHPVVCLDEFEALLNEAFDDRFFNGLRSWANEGLLTWVTASAVPLAELVLLTDLTSPFFNLLATVELNELAQAESVRLLDLADETPFRFTPTERKWIRTLAGNHPYHLQIVCWRLWQCKANGTSISKRELRHFLCQQPYPPERFTDEYFYAKARKILSTIAIIGFFLLSTTILFWQNWIFLHERITDVWDWMKPIGDQLGWFADATSGLIILTIICVVVIGGILQSQNLQGMIKHLWTRLAG